MGAATGVLGVVRVVLSHHPPLWLGGYPTEIFI